MAKQDQAPTIPADGVYHVDGETITVAFTIPRFADIESRGQTIRTDRAAYPTDILAAMFDYGQFQKLIDSASGAKAGAEKDAGDSWSEMDADERESAMADWTLDRMTATDEQLRNGTWGRTRVGTGDPLDSFRAQVARDLMKLVKANESLRKEYKRRLGDKNVDVPLVIELCGLDVDAEPTDSNVVRARDLFLIAAVRTGRIVNAKGSAVSSDELDVLARTRKADAEAEATRKAERKAAMLGLGPNLDV